MTKSPSKSSSKPPSKSASTPEATRPDLSECRALIIDGNATTRSVQADMLRQMGLSNIVQCSRLLDGRRAIEGKVFDIILCDYHFGNSPVSGQDLLDDLRRAQLLPYSTVFIMITGEASYTKVAEVAEAALDSYLLRPHTAAALEERLLQAHHRKKTLGPVFSAIEAGDFETAARMCVERFDKRGRYWLYAARIGAELNIRLGNHQKARELYEAVQETKALPWAKLGIARTQIEEGKYPEAKRTLETLISEQPTYADAYDVMGRLQVEQGDLSGALETYRNATHITPFSVTRLQKEGMLAFLWGETDRAAETLERAVRCGISSRMFDCQTLVMLCMLQFDKRDSRALYRTHDNMTQASERVPESARLRRFLTVCTTFRLLTEKKIGECISLIRDMTGEILLEQFDFEAATNLLATLARLRQVEVQLEDDEIWVKTLASRFCVSKAATEMLCLAAASHEPFVELIRSSQQGIATAAQKAMHHSVSGSHAAAVKALMIKGSETRNAKLIELAGMVLHHHGAKINDSDTMRLIINDLKAKYCSQGTQVSLGNSNARASGGINLRAP